MNENHQTVIDSVIIILDDTNLNVMIEDVVNRLVSFGYDPTETDAWMIAFNMQKTIDYVLNEINHQTVPEGLHHVTVDMVCGEILNSKFLSGQLDMNALDLNGIIQSVKMGDTQVNFSADGSDESKAQELFRWMIQGKGSELLCYRKMRW